MRVSRWIVPVLALLVVGLVPQSQAFAEGRLDPSFGDSGVVDLAAEVPKDRSLGAMALAPDGGIVFTEERIACPRSGCFYDVYLQKRYRPNGKRDVSFDAGSSPVADQTWGGGMIEIDSAGRTLIAWQTEDESVRIRRFLRSGRPDQSFGDSSTVILDCGCGLSSLAITPGGRLLVAASSEFKRTEPYLGVIWVLARLRPDGSWDRSFGGDGIVRLPMRGYYGAAASAGPHGASLLSGFRCCGREPESPFVSRLSTRGNLDRRFAATATRSLLGLYGTKAGNIGWEATTLIGRSHGAVELFGSAYGRAVAVRLLASGKRDLSFGRKGVALLPLDLASATSDGQGGTFVAGIRRNEYQVRRLAPDGDVDRQFGAVVLPGAYNEYGVDIASASPGRAIVFAPGESFCRQTCPPQPAMFRVLR